MRLVLLALSILFPRPAHATVIEWDLAKKMTVNCHIATVFQFHNLTVSLTGIDGRAYTTTEPYLDAIIDAIDTYNPPCLIGIASE